MLGITPSSAVNRPAEKPLSRFAIAFEMTATSSDPPFTLKGGGLELLFKNCVLAGENVRI